MNQIIDFHSLVNFDTIFKPRNYNPYKVANMWYSFSIFIPKLLARLAIKSNSISVFSKLISISNEEMGDGRIKNIHSQLFKESCEKYSLKINDEFNVKAFNIFQKIEQKKISDQYILGLHLGLEIVANENIDQLIKILGKNNSDKIALTKFFRIHLVNEDKHIEKCLNNYSMCKSVIEKEDFMKGFRLSLKFWERYWIEAGKDA